MVTLPNGNALLFAGIKNDVSERFNDLWLLTVSGDNATWMEINATSDLPAPRWLHTMVALSDDMFLTFGGEALDGSSD